MRLTRYTDYAMRVLLYVGARPEGELTPISEISRAYRISQNHLMKVVNDLVNAGYLESVRGRFGGVRLARAPAEINIGAVIRHTEEGFELVDCGACLIARACGFSGALGKALNAFMTVLDGFTLADMITQPHDFAKLFATTEAAAIHS